MMRVLLPWSIYAYVALLLCSKPCITVAQAVCRWVEAVEFCTATVEGEEGDMFVSTNIASAVCFANTDESAEGGCFEETSVCVAAHFPPAVTKWCLPVTQQFVMYADVSNGNAAFNSCNMKNASWTNPGSGTTCGEHRETMYTGLGCDTCAATYEEVFSIMPSCYAATSEVECAAAASMPAVAVETETETGEEGSKFGAYGGFKFDEATAADFEKVRGVEGVVTSAVATGPPLSAGVAALAAAAGAALAAWGL